MADGGHLFTALRVPPSNLQAEQALLGALMANNQALDRVAEFLLPEHFADALHGAIYAAIRRFVDAGRVADAITLRPEFDNDAEMVRAGGAARYLAELLGGMVGIINAGEYGRLILEAWQRRQLVDLGERVVNDAYQPAEGERAPQMIERADAALQALAEGHAEAKLLKAGDAASAVLATLGAAMERGGGITGVTTGFRGLDRMLGGMNPGDLIVIGARPSMGKTALGLAMAARAAAVGHAGLFVSAEMTAEAVTARLVAALSGLPVNAVRRGWVEDEDGRGRRLDQREVDRITQAATAVHRLPLVFDDQPRATTAGIRARARRLKRLGKLDFIMVDYLGKLRASDTALRSANLVYQISELIGDLKALAMELRVPVVVLSQLSRALEQRDDKRPMMSDLRDSGSIEQDADTIMFLYREHYYLSREIPTKRAKERGEDFDERMAAWERAVASSVGRAEVGIAKQRNGPTGPVRMRFRDSLTWFFDEGEEDGGAVVPGLAL